MKEKQNSKKEKGSILETEPFKLIQKLFQTII